MKNKVNIIIEGIDKIRKIKAGMNKGRIFSEKGELLLEEALDIKYEFICTTILRSEDTKLKMSRAASQPR
jgi:hypothetical protein